jgi:hypothetical protein
MSISRAIKKALQAGRLSSVERPGPCSLRRSTSVSGVARPLSFRRYARDVARPRGGSSDDLTTPSAHDLPASATPPRRLEQGGLPACAATQAGSPSRQRLSNGRQTNCRAAAWAHLRLFSSGSVLSMSGRSAARAARLTPVSHASTSNARPLGERRGVDDAARSTFLHPEPSGQNGLQLDTRGRGAR